ncbi:MAG: hypothetical protein OXI41_06565 [Chloroflexota bacterium]|nr:hypothetical protein [Chloroflexota bacterium]MDE2894421.1 hypothetical protein [Chloroflexota bacterium]
MVDRESDDAAAAPRSDAYRERLVSRLPSTLDDVDRRVYIAVIDVFLPELIEMRTELTALRDEIQGTRRGMSSMEIRFGLVEAKFNDFLDRFTPD